MESHGADAVRLFMMFASPPEQTLEWSEAGLDGMLRFLKRLWKLVQDHAGGHPSPQPPLAGGGGEFNAAQKEMRHKTHETLRKISDDIGRRNSYNTAIAAAMELLNALYKFEDASPQGRAVMQEALDMLVAVLSPIVPHICHELWLALGHATPVIDARWPQPDAAALKTDTVTLVVQVNGKLRGRIEVASDASNDEVVAVALSDENVKKFLTGPLKKQVVVPGKLVNFVV